MAEMNSKHAADVSRSLGLDHKTLRGKRWKRWLGLAVLALVVVVSILLFTKSRKGAEAVVYETKEAQRGNLTISVTATGNLEPTNEIDVGIEVSGTVSKVEADYNDHVTVGQVLARLDVSKLQAQVMKLKSSLESARTMVLKTEANVKQAKSELDRLLQVQKLSGGKVPSQIEIDAADAAYQGAAADVASAKASVSEAEANLQVQETDLSKAVIRSPVNGIVLTRAIEPGQTVAASFQAPTLFTLAEDLTKMELHVDVDEADVGKVKEGQAATFTVDAYPERKFDALVTSVRYGSKEVSGVITYETVLNVDNTDLSLRPGMTATADIVVNEAKDAILVPNAALRFTPPSTVKAAATQKSSGLVSALMPHPPRFSSTDKKAVKNGTHQTVWILRDGKPVSVNLNVGMSDGSMTEAVSGEIKPGLPLIVDTRSKAK
ncbi:MAG: efflux RND transporter periplasmic adaptor subunit [Candidatus Latescibacterota bacterium]